MSVEAPSAPRKTIAVVLKCCVDLVVTAMSEHSGLYPSRWWWCQQSVLRHCQQSMICRVLSLLHMSMVTMDTRCARIDFMPAVSHPLGEHPHGAAATVFSQEQTECTRVKFDGVFKGSHSVLAQATPPVTATADFGVHVFVASRRMDGGAATQAALQGRAVRPT